MSELQYDSYPAVRRERVSPGFMNSERDSTIMKLSNFKNNHPILHKLLSPAYELARRINYKHELYPTYKKVNDSYFRTYEIVDTIDDSTLDLLLQEGSSGDVLYDVGSYVGNFSISYLMNVPHSQIAAFEPNPNTYEYLKKNFDINLSDERYNLFNMGIGNSSDSMDFYVSTIPQRSSFIKEGAESNGGDVKYTKKIPIKTLDSLKNDCDIDPPDHIKIDTEGFGLDVLRGSECILSEHSPKIYIEYHTYDDSGSTSYDIIQYLERREYETSLIDNCLFAEPIKTG